MLGGHLRLLVELGAVPRVGVYDGEPAISVRRGRTLIYTADYLRLKGTLGMGSVVLAKGHPERKGCVERVNGYLETSFLPGRRFADRDDFNTQLGDWLEHKANVRVHSGLRCRPSERIDEDLAAMIALPPVLPDMDSHRDLRLPADHWVRHHTNDYSVHPKAVGRRVHLKVDDASGRGHPGRRGGGPPRPGPGHPRHGHRPGPRQGPRGGPSPRRRPQAADPQRCRGPRPGRV